MSDPEQPSKIHFRGTIIEMGEPSQRGDVGEPTVTVTMRVPLHDARRIGPALLYNPTSYSANAGSEPSFDVRKGSVVIVESTEPDEKKRVLGEYRVRFSRTTGLYMVDTESEAEFTIALKQY